MWGDLVSGLPTPRELEPILTRASAPFAGIGAGGRGRLFVHMGMGYERMEQTTKTLAVADRRLKLRASARKRTLGYITHTKTTHSAPAAAKDAEQRRPAGKRHTTHTHDVIRSSSAPSAFSISIPYLMQLTQEGSVILHDRDDGRFDHVSVSYETRR